MKFNGNGVISEEIFRATLVGARIGINFNEIIVAKNSEKDVAPLLERLKALEFEYDEDKIVRDLEVGGSYFPLLDSIVVNTDYILKAAFGIAPEYFGEMSERALKEAKEQFSLETFEDFWKYLIIDTIVHESFHAFQYKETRGDWFKEAMISESYLLREAHSYFIEEECERETDNRILEMVEDSSFRLLLDAIPNDIPEKCGITLKDSRCLTVLQSVFPGIDASHSGTQVV